VSEPEGGEGHERKEGRDRRVHHGRSPGWLTTDWKSPIPPSIHPSILHLGRYPCLRQTGCWGLGVATSGRHCCCLAFRRCFDHHIEDKALYIQEEKEGMHRRRQAGRQAERQEKKQQQEQQEHPPPSPSPACDAGPHCVAIPGCFCERHHLTQTRGRCPLWAWRAGSETGWGT